MKAYSVSEISQILKAAFENPAFSNLPVYGEVYSIKLGKFSYIELGDQGNKQTNSPLLRCAFSTFYGNNYHLEEIKVGDVIMITGKLSYYPHGSSVTLWGNEVEILKSQEGKNLLAKKKTLEKLDKLGYLDEKRKRKIPAYCKKVAILTAESGAAYQDILKTLHDRFPVSSVLYPCIVQGDNAARSMTTALLKAQEGDYDCILLGRGGGSKTDLSCFDDEKLSLAIAESKIPVITCIGHTIDLAIADRVSDIRAITPTEGASLINPSKDEVIQRRKDFDSQLEEGIKSIIRSYAMNLSAYQEKLEAYSPKNKIKNERDKIAQLKDKLDLLYQAKIQQKRNDQALYRNKIDHLIKSLLQKKKLERNQYTSLLDNLDPKRFASKGYALIYKDGKKITSIGQLNEDDTITITYHDGRKDAIIKERK
jgi:exodeoxyribonuclease VII large subunit